jgi:carbon storage regulator CsrA
MLVLTRGPDDRLVISKDGQVVAELVIVEVRGRKVRIGIQADANVSIDRIEVWQRKQTEGSVRDRAATGTAG